MKVISIILVSIILLVSCTTAREVEVVEDIKIDEVTETEISQEEFEELFGKKDYFSFPEEIIVDAPLQPLVFEELEEEVIVEEETMIVEIVDPIEESDASDMITFVFPVREDESEWIPVPEIEIVDIDDSIEPEIAEHVPLIPSAPELHILPQSAEISAGDSFTPTNEREMIETQEEHAEAYIETNVTEFAERDVFEEEPFITLDSVFDGLEKVEPKRQSIFTFLSSKPILNAMLMAFLAFALIAYIIKRIAERNVDRFQNVSETYVSPDKREEEEPEPPTLSNVGVPERLDASAEMDLLKGEEKYSNLVESNLA